MGFLNAEYCANTQIYPQYATDYAEYSHTYFILLYALCIVRLMGFAAAAKYMMIIIIIIIITDIITYIKDWRALKRRKEI